MLNKYNSNRAKIHFFKLSLVERASIFIEKVFLMIKDVFRFLKLDSPIIMIAIKQSLFVIFTIFIANKFGRILILNDSFRNIDIISRILNKTSFLVDNYNQYLLACLGVGGFLVALFLSNLSGIITTKYINIVSKVSLSVLNEYANKKYLKSMINYLCFVIIQLCCCIFNIELSPLIALLSVFLTIRIIIIYFELAQRVYLFSDINMLTKTIYQEINLRFSFVQKAIKNNKTDSIFNSYGNQIISLLDTLTALQKEIIKGKNIEDIEDFTIYAFAIVVKYSEIKNLIPQDSKWFKLKYEPVNWFEADSVEVNLRTRTGTSLNNKPIVDYYFLEEYISNLFNTSIDFLIENKKNKELYKVINNYIISLDLVLTNCGDFDYWVKFNDSIEDKIINSNLIEDDNFVAIIDFFSLNRATFLLNIQKYIENTYNDYFKSGIRQFGNFIINSHNNILFVDKEVVSFVEKIRYEKKLEGKQITSNQYIREFLESKFIKEMYLLLKVLETNYEKICDQARQLANNKKNLSSCLLYSRIIEIEKKTTMVNDELFSIYEELIKDENNFKFEKINIKEISSKINQYHYTNLIDYARTFLNSDSCNYENSKIDFCGEIFYNFSESLFQTIIDNDYYNFEKIYQYYPGICFMADSFVYNSLDKNASPNYLLSKYRIPLVTFMDLSGCIIYHSHVIKDKRWEEKVKYTFEQIINKMDNKYEVLKKMALFASIDSTSFDMVDMSLSIMPRYSNYMLSNNLIKFKECKDSFYFHKEIDTDDELIKKFTHIDFNEYVDFYYKFYEIFIIKYVNPLLNIKDKYKSHLSLKKEGVKNDK